MWIRCRGNVFTEPLLSNDRGIHIQTHRLIRGIYEVRRWDGLRCHDIRTKFNKDYFRYLEVERGIQTHREHGDLISLFLFFQNKESRLKIMKQEVLGRTNRLLSSIHVPHWKRWVLQFFYCCVCIRYRGNVSATIGEFLPSRCLATIRGFLPIRCLAMIEGYTDRQKHTYTQTGMWSHKPTLFFQNKESTLKVCKGNQSLREEDPIIATLFIPK
jgi:hypothetical protein